MKFIKKVGLVFCMLGVAVGGNTKPMVIHELNELEKTLGCIKPQTKENFDFVECINLKGFARVANMIQTPFGGMAYPGGLVDKTGKIILPAEYHEIYYPLDWQYDSSYANTDKKLPDGFVIVIKRDLDNNPMFGKLGVDDVYGAVDEHGKFIVPLGKYDEIYEHYDNNLIRVRKNDKYGFINNQGKEMIPLIYDNAYNFDQGFANVSFNKQWGVINTKGETVFDFGKYNFIKTLDNLDGKIYFAVKQNEQLALFDEQKNQITEFRYESINPIYFSQLLIVGEKGKFGVIDNKGKEIVPIKYDHIYDTLQSLDKYNYDLPQQYIEVTDDDKTLLFDVNGKLIKQID